MDKYLAYQVFTTVAEQLSFSKAAAALRLPNATVSTTIQDLEASVGVRLLNRTTRTVALTPEGLNFLVRCKQMINDVDEAEAMFRKEPAQMRGKIRIDMSVAGARNMLIPNLPKFLAMHPEIEIELSSTDHRIDLIREGVDLVIRGEGPTDSELIEREIAIVHSANFASQSYIEKYGKPKSIEDLKHHRLIQYTQSFGSKLHGFEYFDGERNREVKMKSSITVNSTVAYSEACIAGLGIAQLPYISGRRGARDGNLVEILPKFRPEPYKMMMVYHERRLLTKRVRVFMEWVESLYREAK